jgi:hypothetical protein
LLIVRSEYEALLSNEHTGFEHSWEIWQPYVSGRCGSAGPAFLGIEAPDSFAKKNILTIIIVLIILQKKIYFINHSTKHSCPDSAQEAAF